MRILAGIVALLMLLGFLAAFGKDDDTSWGRYYWECLLILLAVTAGISALVLFTGLTSYAITGEF